MDFKLSAEQQAIRDQVAHLRGGLARLGVQPGLQRITALETRQAKLETALRQIQASVAAALSLFPNSTTPIRN